MKAESLGNCPNCGAPIRGYECEYCGTRFRLGSIGSLLNFDKGIYQRQEAEVYGPCRGRCGWSWMHVDANPTWSACTGVSIGETLGPSPRRIKPLFLL